MTARSFKWLFLFLECTVLAHVTRTPTRPSARHELLLHFPGTGVKADDAMHLDYINHAASLGFHVMTLDYPNTPTITKACRFKPGACYKQLREQRLYGGGGIEEKNAAIPQFKAKLAELAWGSKFVLNNSSATPDWSKIVLSGHSQGAGHALYAGKKHAVAGIIMLSGGTDDSGKAPWLTDASATDSSRIYGFYHDADGFGKAKEVGAVVVKVLEMWGSAYVDTSCCTGAMLHSKDAAFTCGTSLLDCSAHYASLDKKFSLAWTYMMKRDFNAVSTDAGKSDGSGEQTNDTSTDAGKSNGSGEQTKGTSSSRTRHTYSGSCSALLAVLYAMAAWVLR